MVCFPPHDTVTVLNETREWVRYQWGSQPLEAFYFGEGGGGVSFVFARVFPILSKYFVGTLFLGTFWAY